MADVLVIGYGNDLRNDDGAERVVFVDASIEATELEVRPVRAGAPIPGAMSHHGDPATLLRLAEDVGRIPRTAFAVSIPAERLGLGFEFSATTAAAVDAAVAAVTRLATER